MEDSTESSFFDIKQSVYEVFLNELTYNEEIRLIWRLLWDKGIEFKSINPTYDAELIWFIRNKITKLVNTKEGNRITFILEQGTSHELIL